MEKFAHLGQAQFAPAVLQNIATHKEALAELSITLLKFMDLNLMAQRTRTWLVSTFT
jgi:hypothetical protein